MFLRALSLTLACSLLGAVPGWGPAPLWGPAPGWGQDDLTDLSDPFEDTDRLQSWQRLHDHEGFSSMLKDIGLYAETGCLHVEPNTSFWAHDFRGPFLYKEVEGDFVLTTRLLLRGKRFATPATRYSLAGILARSPQPARPDTWVPGRENWVSVMAGSGTAIRKLVFETRSTRNSETTAAAVPMGRNWTWMELRMVRAGSTFLFLGRLEGAPWTVVGREERADLPDRLQVGLAACDDWMSALPLHRDPVAFNLGQAKGSPDLEVLFDYANFARPDLPDGVASELANPEVPDARILELFAD